MGTLKQHTTNLGVDFTTFTRVIQARDYKRGRFVGSLHSLTHRQTNKQERKHLSKICKNKGYETHVYCTELYKLACLVVLSLYSPLQCLEIENKTIIC